MNAEHGYNGPNVGEWIDDEKRGRCRIMTVRDFCFEMEDVRGKWWRVSDIRARAACERCGARCDAPELVEVDGATFDALPMSGLRFCSQDCVDSWVDAYDAREG